MSNIISSDKEASYGPRGWRSVFRPVLIILLGLGFLIILPTLFLSRLGVALDLRGRTLVGLTGTLIAELILFGFLIRWLKGQGRSLKDIGWKSFYNHAGGNSWSCVRSGIWFVYIVQSAHRGPSHRNQLV